MRSNLPPGAAEDPTAPYNKKTKIVEVTISQTLSSIQRIEVPEDFDEKNIDALETYTEKQIVLPSDCLKTCGYFDWDVDDFCVI